jgi:hypothetical protein
MSGVNGELLAVEGSYFVRICTVVIFKLIIINVLLNLHAFCATCLEKCYRSVRLYASYQQDLKYVDPTGISLVHYLWYYLRHLLIQLL